MHAWRWLLLALTLFAFVAQGDDGFQAVTPERALNFPRDFGAHPTYRTEWWYITGWLTDDRDHERGFQLTFFRSATGIGADNPSRFAPRQLILAHAALADPHTGHLLHDERAARELPPLAELSRTDTQARIENWVLQRDPDSGNYQAQIETDAFALTLSLTPSGPPVLNGRGGFSQKSPDPQEASYYYSRPQLQVRGMLQLDDRQHPVTGHAWLDHEWSTAYLPAQAAGWDWIGINLHDGGSLMAYQMRRADGAPLWAGGTLKRPGQPPRVLGPNEIAFTPQRYWQSARTATDYPVEWTLTLPGSQWQLRPLMEDQELDARRSTATIYWEGAVRVLDASATEDNAVEVGQGYLEMTGYWRRQSGLDGS